MREVSDLVFAKVYPMYVQKAERKGRTKKEVDRIIGWLTGYDAKGIKGHLGRESTFAAFFSQAPAPNPDRRLITGIVCGVRVEDIKDPVTREVRYLDKLIDELAQGRAMEKILRGTGKT